MLLAVAKLPVPKIAVYGIATLWSSYSACRWPAHVPKLSLETAFPKIPCAYGFRESNVLVGYT
jgi:hypothetical protein